MPHVFTRTVEIKRRAETYAASFSLFTHQPTTAVDKQILPDALNRCVAAGECRITGCLAEEHVRQ